MNPSNKVNSDIGIFGGKKSHIAFFYFILLMTVNIVLTVSISNAI